MVFLCSVAILLLHELLACWYLLTDVGWSLWQIYGGAQ